MYPQFQNAVGTLFHAISVRESLTFFCEMLVTIRIPELPFVYYFIIILNLT